MSELQSFEEQELLARARSGDEQAFVWLVEHYQRPVFNLCYRMLGEAGEAEDAAQEAFLRAHRNMHRYDPGRSFKTWLLSIAAHYCIDQLRKRRLTTISLEVIPPWHEKPAPEPGPEDRLMQQERAVQVQELLQSLPERDRAAVVLRYWYDLSYEEIAQTLDLTVSAVKSRLHRARRELASEWNHRPQPALANGGRPDGVSAF